MVLTKKDMAKAPINKILKWLAVADMFVMIEYIPFASTQYIYMKQGKILIDWWFYMIDEPPHTALIKYNSHIK